MNRRSELRDRIEVGAFAGFVAGVVAFLLVLLYGLVAGFGREVGPAWGPFLRLHAGYVGLYALVGAAIGAAWPRRVSWGGRWALWLGFTAAGALTVFSVVHGAPGGWSRGEWLQYLVAALLFPLVFMGARRSRTPG